METSLKSGRGSRSIQLKYKFTHEDCFALLLGLIWADTILITYVRAVLIRVPYISDYREDILTYMFLLVLILSLPYMVKRIRPGLLVIYLSCTAVYLVNMLLYPRNREALGENFVPFLIESLPLIFVGAAMDLKKNYRMLHIISLVSVIVKFIHLLIEPNNVIYGDMDSSYKLLPHVCVLIAAALSKKDLLNISVSVVGIFTIISFGTRGPILCMLVLVICYMIFFEKIHKHIWFFCTVLLLVLCIIFFYDEFVQLILSLIQKMGMSTRIFDMLLAGDIMESSGRNVIQARLLEAVSDNWFGYGIAGDRAIVGAYAHNILVEFLVSYGLILGTALFVIPLLYTVVLLVRKIKNHQIEDTYILALISACYIKLFLSGTYLTESLLYLLIGVLLTEHRVLKHKK